MLWGPDERKQACPAASQRVTRISGTTVSTEAVKRPFSKRGTGQHLETFWCSQLGKGALLTPYRAQDGPHSKE